MLHPNLLDALCKLITKLSVVVVVVVIGGGGGGGGGAIFTTLHFMCNL